MIRYENSVERKLRKFETAERADATVDNQFEKVKMEGTEGTTVSSENSKRKPGKIARGENTDQESEI